MLQSNSTLTTLNLGENSIGDALLNQIVAMVHWHMEHSPDRKTNAETPVPFSLDSLDSSPQGDILFIKEDIVNINELSSQITNMATKGDLQLYATQNQVFAATDMPSGMTLSLIEEMQGKIS